VSICRGISKLVKVPERDAMLLQEQLEISSREIRGMDGTIAHVDHGSNPLLLENPEQVIGLAGIQELRYQFHFHSSAR
jgi:hypothetical protein